MNFPFLSFFLFFFLNNDPYAELIHHEVVATAAVDFNLHIKQFNFFL